MCASGGVDIALASIIIFALPGTSAWTLGLLVEINMIFGGMALFATGLHARAEWAERRNIVGQVLKRESDSGLNL